MPAFRPSAVAVLIAVAVPAQAQEPVEKPPVRTIDSTRIVRAPGDTTTDTTKAGTGGVVTSGPKLSPPTATTPGVVTAPGRYRVTLNGFTVLRQTYDNPIQTDGKGDEIYFAGWVAVIDTASPMMVQHYVVQSREVGDRNGYTYRVRAGSASQLGGIRTGDKFPATPTQRAGPVSPDSLPMLLWEGELVPGRSAVVVTPTVWEWDHNPELFAYWVVSRGAMLDRVMKPEVLLASINNRSWFPLDLGSPGLVVHTNMFADNRDRPIGLELGRPAPEASFVAPQPADRPPGGSLLGAIAETILRFTDRAQPLAQKYSPLLAKLMETAGRVAQFAATASRKTPLPYDAADASLARGAMSRFLEQSGGAGMLARPKSLQSLQGALRSVVRDYTAREVYF
ncbi:MAG TPA: hypothetical protein VFV33_21725, partial [Gemmatimonadaceae bacterium]|nr:hypothetical protein [Gemmatimonadaceae bacterium]